MKVSKINATKRFKKITKNVKKQPPELFYKIRCSLKFRFFIEHLQATASYCFYERFLTLLKRVLLALITIALKSVA